MSELSSDSAPPADLPRESSAQVEIPSEPETPQTPVSEALPELVATPSEPVPASTLEPIIEATAPELAPQNPTPSEPAKPVSEAVQEPTPQEPVQTELEKPSQTQTSQPTASAAESTARQTSTAIVAVSAEAARELLKKARAKRQLLKQQKLEKIMTVFEKKKKITNDDVEKLLHCSDATALRYLNQLVKQGKIQRLGRTGAGVEYIKA